jgi:hypothetical protein
MDTLAYLLNCERAPVLLAVLLLFTILVEIAPKSITRLNSNAYTSQVRWNVTLKGLRFQLVHYILYHRGLVSQVVHAITFVIDCILWTTYFHYLLRDNLAWAYFFIFGVCAVQALTFEDVALKITLVACSLVLALISAVTYELLMFVVPDGLFLGYISLLLLLNAVLRVVSHFPEALPIDFHLLKNTTPIQNWAADRKYVQYIISNYHGTIPILCSGILTELHAGFPVRLFTSCFVLLLTKMNWNATGLNIKELHERADNIDLKGWCADEDCQSVFEIQLNEEDKDIQEMHAVAAAQRWCNRTPEEKIAKKTWLRKDKKRNLRKDLMKYYDLDISSPRENVSVS